MKSLLAASLPIFALLGSASAQELSHEPRNPPQVAHRIGVSPKTVYVCPDVFVFADGMGDEPKCQLQDAYFEWLNRSSSTCNSFQFYAISLPENTSALVVAAWGGEGNGEGWADLYLRSGAKPDLETYDFVSRGVASNDETIEVTDPAAGIWWIGLASNCGYTGVSLAATWSR
jgi:hypothetical protein